MISFQRLCLLPEPDDYLSEETVAAVELQETENKDDF